MSSLPHLRAPVRLLGLLLPALLLAAALPAAARDTATPRAPAPAYRWPVPGPPVRAFDAPATPFGPGHRGVDLPVRAGQPVHPMAAGVVTWSGTIAGDTWTTLTHTDGIVTSYGPLRDTLDASTGTPVSPGTVIGRARGDAHGTSGRLHVGARRDGRYVDPAALVGAGARVATLVGPGEVVADLPSGDGGGGGVGPATLVPGTPPSPNQLVVLAGLTSRTGEQPFHLDRLGYTDAATWQQYSYRGVDGDGRPRPYDHRATWGRVHDMAVALRDQLRAHAARRPGEAVDLLGHSLGGLVGMYYLLVLHDPTDPTLPAVGRVMTVASPLEGADSANAADLARSTELGRMVLDLVEAHQLTPPGGDGPVMHDQMPVLDDLQTDSPVVAAVAEAWQRHRADPFAGPLATGTEVLTIGSILDPIVNEHRSDLPGAAHEVVLDPDLPHTHGDVTRADRTEALLAASLAGEPLPDGGWAQPLVEVGAGAGSGVVAAVEYAVAAGLTAVGELVGH